jgi:hypothetical protein
MTPAADFHGSGDRAALPGEQAASAFALASRSTSAYTFVVLMLACPNHPRIVLISTPARRRCVAVVWLLYLPRYSRHACGYKLASEGQDTRAIQEYLGHKNTTHTVRYTELSPERFKNFWRD